MTRYEMRYGTKAHELRFTRNGFRPFEARYFGGASTYGANGLCTTCGEYATRVRAVKGRRRRHWRAYCEPCAKRKLAKLLACKHHWFWNGIGGTRFHRHTGHELNATHFNKCTKCGKRREVYTVTGNTVRR